MKKNQNREKRISQIDGLPESCVSRSPPTHAQLVQRAPAIYEARTHTLQRAHAHPTFVHT